MILALRSTIFRMLTVPKQDRVYCDLQETILQVEVKKKKLCGESRKSFEVSR